MSTNQDEKKIAEDIAPAQPASDSDSSKTQSPAKPARKILIGSQRDEADPNLGSRMTIRDASLSPQHVGAAIQNMETKVATPENASEPKVSEPKVSETTVSETTVSETTVSETTVSETTVSETTVSETTVSETTVGEPTSIESTVIDPKGDDTPEKSRSLKTETESRPPEVEASSVPLPAHVYEVPSASSVDAELEAAMDNVQMDSLLEREQPADDLEIDTRLKALVTRLHNENVFFSLKGRFEGVASKRQFKSIPEEGAMLDVVITGFNEDEGLYEVTIPGASVSVADWSDLVEGAVIEAKVTGSNTGGLELSVNQIRGFMPASQIDIVRVENFGDYVNQKLQCVVTEVNPGRKRLVLSRRAILEREKNEKKKELLKTLTAGQTLDGIVTKLMDFGAFVDIGGVEGLVHVSKMSWERVGHPSEVFETGQKISVKVEKINAESGKISLSFRDTLENPWTKIDQKYPEGSLMEGTVSRLAQFGAFVKLEPGVEGLIHISELAHHRVMAVKNVVKQGDSVQVKILSVDPQAQKIGLSLKATLAKPERADAKAREDDSNDPIRESAVRKRNEPLKGGRDKSSGGEQFGLNW